MELKDYEIDQVHGNFAITLPRNSEQHDSRNKLRKKIWQEKPPRK